MAELSPVFDCDARMRALTPPGIVIGGFHYHGRLLSIVQWMPHLEQLDALRVRQDAHEKAAEENRALDAQQDTRPRVPVPSAPALREWIALYRKYIRAVLPGSERRSWRRWYYGDPAKRIDNAPDPSLLAAVFWHFFNYQSRAMQALALEAAPSENPSPAPGSISNGSAPPESADAPASATAG